MAAATWEPEFTALAKRRLNSRGTVPADVVHQHIDERYRARAKRAKYARPRADLGISPCPLAP